MAGIIRIRVLEVLAATLERLVPELAGRTCAGPAEHPHKQSFPHLSIVPVRWRFFPDQDGDVWTTVGTSRAVFNVGRHEALLQLRLGARTARERYALEHAVSQVFVSQEGRPGVLVARVADCHNALIAYEFDDTEWDNEKAFDKEWFSISTVTTQVPALVERGGIYTIDEIRSTFTEDMETAFDSLPSSAHETIAVDENGDVTVSSPSP